MLAGSNWQYVQNPAVAPYYHALKKKRCSLVLKRLFDIIISLALLVFLSPILIFVAIWIKLDSKGPVFFRQTRVTTGGKQFQIFKFRTMVNEAEKLGTQVTTQGDARITNVGSKLRNLRIDEMPQLINVLAGDMSFVGTRPEVPKYVAAYTDEMMATLLMPAGITSTASVMFKDEAQLLQQATDADQTYITQVLPQKMQYNLQYIKEFSFVKDLCIMLKTAVGVFG